MPHTQLEQQLSAAYEPCCVAHAHSHFKPLAATEDELDEMLSRIIRKVWKEKGMPNALADDLVRYYAEELWAAIVDGYGDDLTTVDLDTVDEEMLRRLQTDVFHFSAAKNYQQLRALSDALTDEAGKRRTWNEFRTAAYKINDVHVGQWLKAEYELAQVSAQAASKWVQIQRDKEDLPLLEFKAIIDEATSDICRNFNGIILPIDHWFWTKYYIPNHFGERSDIVQTDAGTITDITDIVFPERIPAMFKKNLAAEGLAFPDEHPYYTGLPDDLKTKADQLRDKYGQ